MAAKRRMLLAEFKPRVPQPAQYGTWNPSDRHADILLSGGNLVATKSVVATGLWRCVRGTTPIQKGQAYWETQYIFTGTGDLCAGIATLNVSLAEQPGNGTVVTDEVVAGPIRAGTCFFEQGPTGTGVGTIASGDIIRHWLDADAGVYRVAKNGGAWVEVLSGGNLAQYNWYPIAGFVRPSGSTVSITINQGASAFVYAVPDGVSAGIASYPAAVATTLYASSGPMNTNPLDTPSSISYLARIVAEQDVETDVEESCWVWGDEPQVSRGGVVLVNNDGKLNAWLTYEWKDAIYTLYEGYEGDARSTFTVYSSGKCDRCKPTSGRRLAVTFADPLAELDRAMQTLMFPSTQANAQLAGRPKPICIGRPLYVEVQKLSTGSTARDYQLTDGFTSGNVGAGLTQIDQVYDEGDVFVPTTDWTYYPSSLNKLGFHLVNAPEGKIVANPVGPKRGGTTVIEYLPEVMEYIFARSWSAYGGAAVWNVGWGDVQALDAKAHYRLADFFIEPTTLYSFARAVMDCFCGCILPRLDGTITVTRVEEPSNTPVLTLDETNIIGDIDVEDDEAKGLSQSIAGARNHSPHSFSDIADSVKDPTSPDYNPGLVAKLTTEWTCIREGAAVLSPGDNSPVSAVYAQAINAAPFKTMLQDPIHIEAEANRVCTTWRPRRSFYSGTALITASAAKTLEPGQTVRLVWPKLGLGAGINLRVKRVRKRFWSRRVELKLWGRSPA